MEIRKRGILAINKKRSLWRKTNVEITACHHVNSISQEVHETVRTFEGSMTGWYHVAVGKNMAEGYLDLTQSLDRAWVVG
jgi:hypothetical protein